MPNLVLSRRVGQSVTIGDEVTVTVVRMSSGQVRLAIEAPLSMCIVRGELAGGSTREEFEIEDLGSSVE